MDGSVITDNDDGWLTTHKNGNTVQIRVLEDWTTGEIYIIENITYPDARKMHSSIVGIQRTDIDRLIKNLERAVKEYDTLTEEYNQYCMSEENQKALEAHKQHPYYVENTNLTTEQSHDTILLTLKEKD